MCGIIGYVGPRNVPEVLLNGLRRLEYRGYDSAGVAVVGGGDMHVAKRAGKLANLVAELDANPLPPGSVGIGHTRWATHGAPNDVNAHPHTCAGASGSGGGRVSLVHNGIIENYAVLQAELADAGLIPISQTDTEIVALLLGREVDSGMPLPEAMRRVCQRLVGAYTLVAVDANDPGTVVAARRNSPLVVGVGAGENFVASDVAAFIDYTRDAVELGQDQLVVITADTVEVTDFDNNPATTRNYRVEWDLTAAEKDGYDWFMRKEIFEQPQAVADTLLGRMDAEGRLTLDESDISPAELRAVDKIIVVACGTAFYAGLVAKYAIEHWTRISCEVELASEFRYRDPIVDARTLVVTISQSGETMDTLMAVRHAREQGAKVLAICNTNGSTIARESDAVIYTHAGPEIAVASTKGFLTQIVACYLLGLYLAQVRNTLFGDEVNVVLSDLQRMPDAIQQTLNNLEPVYKLARDLVDEPSVLFLGRHAGYPVALEGALKLKELAYIHAEGFAAGELKHGPIALIKEGLPVFVVVPPKGRDQLHDKVVSNIAEIRARGARTIVLAEQDDPDVISYADTVLGLPKVPTLLQPLLATVPLQVFACELATLQGNDVDQPRNLAKSVTVE